MAVRHLGELKKKKNPMEPELKSRFTNPPTLWAYISPKPQRPGHRQTYAKSLRGSRGPGSHHLPQPAARGVARPSEDPRPGPVRPGLAPQAPASTPGRAKQTSGLPRYLRETQEGKKATPPPHAPAGVCSLPQLRPDPHWEPREPGRRRRRPRLSVQPLARGRPRASASPPARQPHPRRRPPRTPAGAALRAPGPRCGAPTAGRHHSGWGTSTRAAAGPHRNALEDAPGRGCPDVFGVAVADNGGLLAAAIAHQVIHVALPTGHLRALRTAAGTARSSRRSGGGGGGSGWRWRGGRRGGGGEEAALRRHRPPPSPRSCGGRTRGRQRGAGCGGRPARLPARSHGADYPAAGGCGAAVPAAAVAAAAPQRGAPSSPRSRRDVRARVRAILPRCPDSEGPGKAGD